MSWKKTIILLLTACAAISAVGPACAAQERWKEYKRRHFIIYYKNAPFDFVETVEKAAEEYYRDITDNLGFTRYKGWNWEDRAKIYIYDDKDDYVEAGKQSEWSHGSAYPKDRTIRTFPLAHGFFDSILPHELGHIIFREFVGFRAKVPLWFEEGVAMNQEKAKRWGAHGMVREAMEDGTFKPLQELTMFSLWRNQTEAYISLFYAEAASAVHYMISELGRQRFVIFCRKLKDGMKFDNALERVYIRYKNQEDLNEAWVKFLKNE